MVQEFSYRGSRMRPIETLTNEMNGSDIWQVPVVGRESMQRVVEDSLGWPSLPSIARERIRRDGPR
jgi:hypothetical protein